MYCLPFVHVCHRRASLWRRHEDGAKFLAGFFVVGAQHCAARMVSSGRDVPFARNDEGFRDERADVVSFAGRCGESPGLSAQG